MTKLSPKEEAILAELESGALPGVAAISLKMDPRTLSNRMSGIKKKCYDSARFLQKMQKHQKVLKLRIKVSIIAEPEKKV